MKILIYCVPHLKKRFISLTKNSINGPFFIFDEYAYKDLTKQSSDFLWFQLFHDVILHLPNDEKAKKQMIEFSQKYQSKEALSLFIENLSLNQMINEALKMKNINQLYALRYFLADLIENLTQQYDKEYLIAYREMKLSNDEFNQLRENTG
jgi:hypothetical protein